MDYPFCCTIESLGIEVSGFLRSTTVLVGNRLCQQEKLVFTSAYNYDCEPVDLQEVSDNPEVVSEVLSYLENLGG